MNNIIFLVLFFIDSSVFVPSSVGYVKGYNFKNYEEARKSEEYVKFQIESTKLGLFASKVDGYARKFYVSGIVEKGKIKKPLIAINIKHMDTDNKIRDRKMHNKCLDFKKYPELKLELNGSIVSDGNIYKMPSNFNIRGKNKKVIVSISMMDLGSYYLIEGKSVMSFKDLEIPDPSIFIAKVHDKILVRFKLKVVK